MRYYQRFDVNKVVDITYKPTIYSIRVTNGDKLGTLRLDICPYFCYTVVEMIVGGLE